MTVTATTTLATILDGVGNTLKPTRFDLQNRAKLFTHKQSQISAAKFLEELRELYDLSNYGDQITKDQIIRDLFISGTVASEVKFYYISRTVTI